MTLFHPVALKIYPSWERYFFHPRRYDTNIVGRNCTSKGNRCDSLSLKDSPPIVLRRMEHQVDDQDNLYTISIEVPGIKMSDLQVSIVKQKTIRVTGDRKGTDGKTTLVKYDQSFYVDKRKVKLSEVTATYEDGVLSIKLPKMPVVNPRTINVLLESPPTQSEGEHDEMTDEPFVTSIDLPGVKLNALSVTLYQQNITIEATRDRGTANFKIKKVLNIDPERIDVDNLKAYLMDGVLTITAPMSSTAPEADHSSHDAAVLVPIKKAGEALTSETNEAKMTDVENDKKPEASSDSTTKETAGEHAITVETVNEDEI